MIFICVWLILLYYILMIIRYICRLGIGLGCCWLFSAAAMAERYATPVRASWAENPQTSVTVSWDTWDAARGTIRYGTSPEYSAIVHDGGGTHRHAITLRGLEPGTFYFYEATSTDGYQQSGTFWTAPEPMAPMHFVIHGDLEGGLVSDEARGVSLAIVNENPQWVIHIGDMSEEAAYDPTLTGFNGWRSFFDICSNELASTVFMPQIGNHDNPEDSWSNRPPGHWYGLYHRLFALPEPSTGNGFYSYTVGNIRYIILNTEDDMPAQNQWLEQELQAAANDRTIEWIMCSAHRPPYSWGERSGDDTAKNNWATLLTQYEANWMLGGHSHTYQRTVPIRDVNYLVTGGGGGRLYGYTTNDGLAFATSCYHYVSIRLTNDVMHLQAIRSDGYLFDSVTVTNQRQVRVEPPFPRRGEAARVLYKNSRGKLVQSNAVSIHLGIDAFTNSFASAPMTWDEGEQAWIYDFVVPATATQRIAFVFYSGNAWENNHEYDWQALLDRAFLSTDAPQAGQTVQVYYEADMGPLAATAQSQTVWVWPAFRDVHGGFTAAVEGHPLSRGSGNRWSGTVELPANAVELLVYFSAGGQVDDAHKRNWSFPVGGADTGIWAAEPFVARATPVITDDPPNSAKNNAGDNFDFDMSSPPLRTKDAAYGFGDWGRIWFNMDTNYLYVGGIDLDMGGTNNVFMLFLGVNTLSDGAWNLFHKSGLPRAVDYLHNLRFTEPMNLAIIFGDQFGDKPTYTNFTYAGYDFGQGIYSIGTNSSVFTPIDGAKLSQFDGQGTIPCATSNDSGSDLRATRWEAAIPWAALVEGRPEDVSHLFVGGVIGSSSAKTNDRYLSRAYLGERAWGRKNEYGQFGYYTVTLRPQRVNFLHADLAGDGLPADWRLQYFGTIGGPPADEDTDADGHTNRQEETAGTDPVNPQSIFAMTAPPPVDGLLTFTWPFHSNRWYDVYTTTNLMDGFTNRLANGIQTDSYSVELPASDGSVFFQLRVRK